MTILRDANKLSEFGINLSNKLQVLRDLLEEPTTESNQKRIRKAISLKCQMLGRKKHQNKEDASSQQRPNKSRESQDTGQKHRSKRVRKSTRTDRRKCIEQRNKINKLGGIRIISQEQRRKTNHKDSVAAKQISGKIRRALKLTGPNEPTIHASITHTTHLDDTPLTMQSGNGINKSRMEKQQDQKACQLKQ